MSACSKPEVDDASEDRSLHLHEAASHTLPAGRHPWRVVEGQVEAYLLSDERRRLVAVVAPGRHVFPLEQEGALRLVLVTSGAARMQCDTQFETRDLLPSARAWMAAHVAQDALPVSEQGVLEQVQAFNASLDARFAAQDAERERATAQRLAQRDQTAVRGTDFADELAWLARRMGAGAIPIERAVSEQPGDIAWRVRRAGLRSRRVTLAPDWMMLDGGPLLLVDAASGSLRAVRWSRGRYRLRDGTALSPEHAAGFLRQAWEIHPTFAPRIDGFAALARFTLWGSSAQLAAVALALCGLALLGLMAPITMAWIFGELVPSGETGLLWAAAIALVSGVLFTGLLQATQNLARGRISGRGTMRLAAALTDHVLRLPASFFRQIPAGDFNQRLENIEQMRRLVTTAVLSAGLTAALAIAYFGIMFAYEARMALIASALSLVYVIAVAITQSFQNRPLREAAALDGRLAGLTYEILDGLPKLRSAAAEDRAMARWLRVYVDERAARIRGETLVNHFSAFAEGYRTFTLMALFAAAAWLARTDLEAGPFIAFLTGFTLFQGTLSKLCQDLLALFAAQPLAERARPILEAEPERSAARADPGPLTGRIEVSGLVFGYGDGSAPLIDGVSFRLAPGEHLAIVGGSGSGKSTLLRLLLGFETPRAGSIAYDGQELSHLDPGRLRGQIGAVLQSSSLFAGSILDNIRGASEASLEQCLAAADQAGLGPDLGRMGMGVHTPITEGGGTFSGGQAQRILIARALAARPRLLFMDEATSALDNLTQAFVARTLDQLQVTRISIAHRLSTVRKADRIAVLERGRLVEMGTYDELMRLDGRFAVLARRQLLGDP